MPPRRYNDVSQESLECRLFGHQWDEIPAKEPRQSSKKFGHFHYSDRCERCGKERHQTWHRKTGARIGSPNYTKPEGFHSIGRDVKSPDLRLELLRRWGEKA